MSREDLLQAYQKMRMIREFADAVHEEFPAGNIPGFVHLYAGEEASGVGVCMHLDDRDAIASTHRGHGHCIAKNCDDNRAKVWNLPAVLVVEDNGYAESTAPAWSVAGSQVERAKGFGMKAYEVDGHDFFAVWEAAREAIEQARNGGGPSLIHVRLNRYYGHFEGDAISYKGQGETVPVDYRIAAVAPAAVSDAEVAAFVDDFKANFVVADAGAGGPEPETVETPVGRINYLEMGDTAGDPIIFIHGYGGDLNNWMFNQEELASSHTTYAIDLPGHSGSTKDVGSGDPGLLLQAIAAFMDTKGIDRAHLVGHSMGGAVALALALNYPEHVASVTAIAPGGLGSEIN